MTARRAIIVRHLDGAERRLELSKATACRTTAQFIHLDQLKDGTWRLLWSEGTVPTMTEIESLTIERTES
jgi:hypothetical protein